ncbi:MAG: hypothetical protein IPP58_14740 [Holophagaceae bacterium]|uniref:Uncharacterized protein n=1 Tax=Candidatus Geothrix skivensis TaxID=2954439 RepID=A0A9D7SJK9_9BACT|nr:hypothetical protein [Candidatus Geothrix skivensis]
MCTSRAPAGAPAAGLLELGGPAPLLVLRFTAEGHGQAAPTVAHQHDEDAPPHIQPLVVIPAAVRCGDAVAHEDQGGTHHQGGLRRGSPQGELGAQLRCQPAPGPLEGQAAAGPVQTDARQVDHLPVAAAVRWEQPLGLQHGFQVAHGQLTAPLARAPAFKQVIGQKGQVGPEGCFIDLWYLGR